MAATKFETRNPKFETAERSETAILLYSRISESHFMSERQHLMTKIQMFQTLAA